MKRKLAYGLAAAGVVLAGVGWFVATRLAPTATGYTAKTLCSAVFVAGRDPDVVRREDLPGGDYVDAEVDTARKEVRASLLGMATRIAVWRPGLGCSLAIGVEPDALRGQGFEPPAVGLGAGPWPQGDGDDGRPDPPGLDRDALDTAVADSFAEPDAESLRRTRAVVVVQGERIVAERYADGFTKGSPHLGWSMTKSVTNALIGIMVERGELDVDAPAPVPEWEALGDPRRDITLDQLMRMSSGLAFEERYGPLADVTSMLFEVHDSAAVAIDQELAEPPDTRFSYSSGTTNILCRILRDRFDDTSAYHRFPHDALFSRIGMASAVFEPDPSGTFVGSSFLYATARDWARFGLLFLRDGVWNGERILPKDWVRYSATASPTAPLGEYGAQWWTNAGPPNDPSKRKFPALPVDAYQAKGFQGQMVLVVPSRDVVMVRLGMTHDRAAWDVDAFAGPILAALP